MGRTRRRTDQRLQLTMEIPQQLRWWRNDHRYRSQVPREIQLLLLLLSTVPSQSSRQQLFRNARSISVLWWATSSSRVSRMVSSCNMFRGRGRPNFYKEECRSSRERLEILVQAPALVLDPHPSQSAGQPGGFPRSTCRLGRLLGRVAINNLLGNQRYRRT